jgi:hypothetical protein
MTIRGAATVALTGLVLCSAGCGGSPAAPTGPAGPVSSGDPAAQPLPEPTQPTSLVLGQATSGVLSAASPRCSYTLDTGVLEGPCRIYGILGGFSGPVAIQARLTWTSDAGLALAMPVRAAATGMAGAACCQSPLNVLAWVYPLDVTPFSVVYTKPQPLDAQHSVSFTISATRR